jgi:hypothetical protein
MYIGDFCIMFFRKKISKILSSRLIRLALVVVVGCAVFQCIHLWEGRGQGFRLYKIQSTPQYEERWDISYSNDDLEHARKAVSQPYHYLAHGFQVYAFCSDDGQYILKFFRHQRLRLPDFVVAIPSFPLFDEWRKSRILSLSRRQDYLFRSCKTSWDLARHETELLMVHLNTTEGIYPTVQIHDLLGNVYSIELDKYQFLLQKKAVLIKPTITKYMQKGEIEEAERCIDKIFDLFLDCAEKGIADTDGALIRKDNLGFFEDRAIYIDGGKLIKRKEPITKKAFVHDIRRLAPLVKWLKQEHPQLIKHFRKSRARAIRAIEELCSVAVPQQEKKNCRSRGTSVCLTPDQDA